MTNLSIFTIPANLTNPGFRKSLSGMLGNIGSHMRPAARSIYQISLGRLTYQKSYYRHPQFLLVMTCTTIIICCSTRPRTKPCLSYPAHFLPITNPNYLSTFHTNIRVRIVFFKCSSSLDYRRRPTAFFSHTTALPCLACNRTHYTHKVSVLIVMCRHFAKRAVRDIIYIRIGVIESKPARGASPKHLSPHHALVQPAANQNRAFCLSGGPGCAAGRRERSSAYSVMVAVLFDSGVG